MDEVQTTKLSTDSSSGKNKGHLNSDALCDLVSNFSKNIQEHFEKLRFKFLKNDDHLTTSEIHTRSNKESSTVELSLERQMDAWKHNPVWVDHPPDIKVTIPKGSLSSLTVTADVGLPPDAAYNIVIDPDNKRVFKNIKEVISRRVVVDEGLRQVVEVEQAVIWRFLWLSGTISVRVLVDQNREDHSVKFKQIKSGFMEKFEGCWRLEPLFVDEELCDSFKPNTIQEYISCSKGRGRVASKLTLEQLIQPAIVPPPPISWYLRGITTKTTEMLMNDLLAEAARIRQASMTQISNASDKDSGERPAVDRRSIKERGAMRRRRVRRAHRRLS